MALVLLLLICRYRPDGTLNQAFQGYFGSSTAGRTGNKPLRASAIC
ncbi:hypothetical protein DFAR_1980008 [Desulfarculales bacterium]